MDIEAFRKAGYAAIDQICEYYETLRERPVKAEVEPGYLIEALPGRLTFIVIALEGKDTRIWKWHSPGL